MRTLGYALLYFMLSACVVSKPITLKKDDIYSIKPEELTSPMVSFSVPDGYWSVSNVTLKTMNQGWFNIHGRPPKSPIGYSIKFSIKKLRKYPASFDKTIILFQSQDFDNYLKVSLNNFTPKIQKEMELTNLGGKLIRYQGLNCANTWYQQKIAPLANNGRGITQFNSNITCPLIIDGDVYQFDLGITSSIDPKFYEWQAGYNKNKRSMDTEITIDTYEHLITLSDKVLGIFGDIKFHGRVSQNYNDVTNPELLDQENPCNDNLRYMRAKECPIHGRDQERIRLTEGQVIFISTSVGNRKNPMQKDILSFTTPEGIWFSNKNRNYNYEKGYIEVSGEMPDSIASYNVKLSVYQSTLSREKTLAYLKKKDWNGYAFESFDVSTLNQIRDDNGRHFGQAAVMFKGFHCRNWWYQIHRDPDDTKRPEAGVFHSIVRCPLVIDGDVYEFNMVILSSIKRNVFGRRDVKVDLNDYLIGLAPKVILAFNEVQFSGKISQSYDDIVNK